MNKLRWPSQSKLDRMSHAEKDAVILKLFDLLDGMEKRLQEIERKVEKTSRNSSKPPSSDGLKRQGRRPNRESRVGGRTEARRGTSGSLGHGQRVRIL